MTIIEFEDYKNLCDSVYSGGELPPQGVVHCPPGKIKEFFRRCEFTRNKYVILSAGADYSIASQREHEVAFDAVKWLEHRIRFQLNRAYSTINLPPRCDLDNCNINDPYSIKCQYFSSHTIPKIPQNIVKWFVSGAWSEFPEDDRIVHIPLGVNYGARETIKKISKENIPKDKYLYCNWELPTVERVLLKFHYMEHAKNDPLITVQPQPNLKFEDYLREMARHQFVLSPKANGASALRDSEAIYLNCIPIVESTPFNRRAGLITMSYENMFRLAPIHIVPQHDSINYQLFQFEYWENQVNQSRRLLDT